MRVAGTKNGASQRSKEEVKKTKGEPKPTINVSTPRFQCPEFTIRGQRSRPTTVWRLEGIGSTLQNPKRTTLSITQRYIVRMLSIGMCIGFVVACAIIVVNLRLDHLGAELESHVIFCGCVLRVRRFSLREK